MLKRINRIPRKEIPRTLKGDRFSGRFFWAFSNSKVGKEEYSGPFRFTAIISKKTAKKAFERNKIRRRFYNALSEVVKEKDFVGDIAFLLKKSSIDGEFCDLKSEIEKAIVFFFQR